MAYLIDVAIPNSHDLHSTITEKLQKYTDIKVELTRLLRLNAVHIVPLVWSSMGINPSKLHDSFKLLNCCLGLYVLMQKAVILHMQYHLKVFSRIMNKKCLVIDQFSLKTN